MYSGYTQQLTGRTLTSIMHMYRYDSQTLRQPPLHPHDGRAVFGAMLLHAHQPRMGVWEHCTERQSMYSGQQQAWVYICAWQCLFSKVPAVDRLSSWERGCTEKRT